MGSKDTHGGFTYRLSIRIDRSCIVSRPRYIVWDGDYCELRTETAGRFRVETCNRASKSTCE